ncbi:MarR family winged helix-turn-helix transcriptional regulator [Nocardioides mesophilus]|uniref:MarR family transcriptional regulator n=1 Tax=Nocardioides mesophilus TaxID=433659 RepID=A0A7G9RE15_9ACTN|nr:MarR family transcriptional regulator [Nocardioides mesophilus]QNN53840.1 MarR family transcriptional regulator [Nocardioides mesophilus]
MTRWLTDKELDAWLKLAGVMLKLGPTLDSQLQRDSDLTHFDYLCLAMLSEAEDHTRRMSDLAATTNASLSRLSHVISKLEKKGWVQRRPCPDSRRVTLVTLTDEGWEVLRKAAPGHVATVHSLVFEDLSPEDVAALERVAGHIVERIDAAGDLDSRC